MSGRGGRDYRVYLSKLDGSPPVLLGSGVGAGISPDNKWIASILPSDTSKVLLLPSGVGEPKSVSAPSFFYSSAFWTSNGRSLVVRGSQSQQPLRFWIQDANGTNPRAITPAGVDSGVLLTVHDSDYVAAADAWGAFQLYPTEGGAPIPIVGATPDDSPVAGSAERDEVFVSPNAGSIPQEIQKLNIVSGARHHFASVAPTDTAGLLGFRVHALTPDQKNCLGTQYRQVSVLYVATGLRSSCPRLAAYGSREFRGKNQLGQLPGTSVFFATDNSFFTHKVALGGVDD